MRLLVSNSYREQSTREEQLQGIADALHHWLSYIYTVAKSDVLLESSLRYSLCEYLERKINVACALEVKHPCFHKRSIDFVWNRKIKTIDADTKNIILEDSDDCYILECKFARDATNSANERQRIFNDLCRLYKVKKEYPKAHALFLMAGESEQFNNKFQNAKTRNFVDTNIFSKHISHSKLIEEQQNKPKTDDFKKEEQQNLTEPQHRASFCDWFKFEMGECETIDTTNATHFENYVAFIEEYDIKTEKEAILIARNTGIKIKTQLLAIRNKAAHAVEAIEEYSTKSHSVAIWEIIPID